MNKFILQQLSKIKIAKINWDGKSTKIFIPKETKIILRDNGYYLIKLSEGINNNQVLISNWNAGSKPLDNCYKVEVNKVLDTMVKVTGVSYDLENKRDTDRVWIGWLPIQDIEILKEL